MIPGLDVFQPSVWSSKTQNAKLPGNSLCSSLNSITNDNAVVPPTASSGRPLAPATHTSRPWFFSCHQLVIRKTQQHIDILLNPVDSPFGQHVIIVFLYYFIFLHAIIEVHKLSALRLRDRWALGAIMFNWVITRTKNSHKSSGNSQNFKPRLHLPDKNKEYQDDLFASCQPGESGEATDGQEINCFHCDGRSPP